MAHTDFKCEDCGATVCSSESTASKKLGIQPQGRYWICCNCEANAEAKYLNITRAEFSELVLHRAIYTKKQGKKDKRFKELNKAYKLLHEIDY